MDFMMSEEQDGDTKMRTWRKAWEFVCRDRLNSEAALIKQMNDQNIANTSVFQDWLAEEKAYLEGLSREPLLETLEMEYWQKLVNLGASQ